MLRNAVGVEGEKCYEGVRFNVSVTREYVPEKSVT